MSGRNLTVAVLVLCISIPAFGAKQHRRSSKAKAKAPVAQSQPQVLQQEAPPQPPPTPEQGPATPPQVTFRSGQLTIIARNSTLADVLNAVRTKTGASVEMPPASSERVVGQFGPGAPRDVIAQLLNGSHFDYVLVGSPTDPGALKKVVLTVRASLPPPTQASNPPPAYNQGYQAQQIAPDQQDQPTEDVNNDIQAEPPPQAEQEEPQGGQPQQPNPNGGPFVKTPEQLLRELQQQQQQQQQGEQPPQ